MRGTFSLIEINDFPKNDLIEIDPNVYYGIRTAIKGTCFNIFVRKKSAIGMERFHKSIGIAWPRWQSFFPIQCPPITILETDWGLGGGSLGPFTIAVHFKEKYDSDSSKYLELILNWPQKPTGSEYINEQFIGFEDPMQAYVTDQVIHELGHIFFLHGITDLKSEADTWFALGLGLVYDRLIWKDVSTTPSPVFEALDHIWKTKFANNFEIDQRLINPNTDNDKKLGLIRLQTYGHAKAHAFLSELRLRIGSSKFDKYVKTYLSRPIGSPITYEEFLSIFSAKDLITVRKTEAEFVVR